MQIACGGSQKTPADIKDRVAWLDARSALPVFPFGTNPIYLYFHSEGSPICSSMTANVFDRPEIIEYMNKHITSISVMPEILDSTDFMGRRISSGDLIKVFQVEGYPSHYFFNKQGQLKGARTGYIGLREFKQLLIYISEGYVEKMDFGSFLGTDGADIDTVWGKF